MSMLLNNEEEEKVSTLMNFAVINGGKDSGPPVDTSDWLTPLEIGTIFLVEEKNNPRNFALGQFQLVSKEQKAVYLISMLNGVVHTFVKPPAFCAQYRLYEILGVVKTQQEEIKEESKDE